MNKKFLEVYNLTKQIPNGKISTYKEIAKSLGNKNLVRIVGYILSKNTGQSVDTISQDTNRDNFMSADVALKYGLIDEIIKPQSKK